MSEIFIDKIKQKAAHKLMDKCQFWHQGSSGSFVEIMGSIVAINEAWYKCSAHRSVRFFIIEISSHKHIKWKQSQRIFLSYSCSVTMINNIKKYLWRKIHELNTLIRCSDDFWSQTENKYTVKNRLLQSKYRWLLPIFR